MLAITPSRTTGYLDAIQKLVPLVEEHRASFDRDRRLPDEVFRALAGAGLFRLWLPEALGGPELSPTEFMQVVEAASAVDGSIGWIVANGGGISRVGGYLAESVAREWFADPKAFIVAATGAVGVAEPVAGGYRVSGRWPFGSGSSHATRFTGLAAVGTNTGQAPIFCYFPREQVTMHDTWHVSGLRGTASSDFEVTNAFVAVDHTHELIAPVPTQPGMLYRIPGLSIFPWSITGAPLGIASGAMAAFTRQATQSKSRLGTTMRLQDREMVQSVVGRAEAGLGATRAFLTEAITALLADLDDDEDGDRLMRSRARLRIACAYAAETAASIVQALATEAGASAIFEHSGLERAVRDMQAAVKHVAMSPYSYIVAGRLRLGLDPGSMRF